jgi:acetyl esterase/lipase
MTRLFRLAFLVLGVAGAAQAQDAAFEQGIEFAKTNGESLQLNLARPKNASGRTPAILCIHGGGFRAGKREGWDARCKLLAEQGYLGVTVTYRLAPKSQFPAAVEDVKAAVRWLRANAEKYSIDPDRIGVIGDSAGGHLAQFLGVTGGVPQFEGDGGNPTFSSRVSCVVNYYGPSDLTRSYGRSVDAAEVLPLWLGGDATKEHRRHILASPLYWVTPGAAPTLILQGTEDKYVNHEQAVWMRDRLKDAEVEVELISFEGAGHGFKGADAEKAWKAALEFFARHLKGAK